MEYNIINGTAYHCDTSDKVIRVLENARVNKQRIRIFYGDVKTGRDWMEHYDTIGTISRSNGTYKIPLLIHNSRSVGGTAILDNCIVKITIDKKVVYKNPKYHLPVQIMKTNNQYSVISDGKVIYNCNSLEKAQKEIAFLEGKRNIV